MVDYSSNFESDYFIEYYTNYRDNLSDLFKSEKYFFERFAEGGNSFLDVGCASGGAHKIISNILSHDIAYTGVDFSSSLIAKAKENVPEGCFILGDFKIISEMSVKYDRVLALGTTVHDLHHRRTLSDCYKLCSGKFLFDIRLSRTEKPLGDVNLGYTDDGSGVPYPYVIDNLYEFIEFLMSLDPQPHRVWIYGYEGTPNIDTTVPQEYEKILMCGVLIEKLSSEMTNSGNLEFSLVIE